MTQHIQIDRRFAIIDEWVLDLDISDRAIRLYAVLARYADKETHKAFPSRGTLAKRLRCSSKSVDRAIQELIDAGLLSKEQRFNSSLVFTIHTVSPPTSRGVDTTVQGGWTPTSRGVDTGDDLTRTTELEPKELEPLNSLFDQFWSIYPKKADKPVARRAFEKALKRTTAEVILNGAQSYRDDPNREQRFTKNPSSWLNADAWENEPLPSKEKLANWQKAVLLSQKYAEESQNEVEQVNRRAVAELEAETTSWLKGVDDE